jgi:uncharacterized protein
MRRAPTTLGVLVACSAFILFVVSAIALNFPALTGRVVDEAAVLDQATRATLTQKLADLEAKSTDQLVVVTLKSLQGTSIEDFGVQLGRQWQIGQKDKNNGVLLVVAPNERKVRIEVGYGLEGTLTDAVSRLIIENSIFPRFRANDVAGGIARGVDDIIQVLTGDADEWKQRTKRPDTVINGPSTQKDSIWPVILIVLVIVGLILFCVILSGLPCQIIFQILLQILLSGGRGSGSSSGSSGGGFSGGGGSFGGGGASGSW